MWKMSEHFDNADLFLSLKTLTAADFAELGTGMVGYVGAEEDDEGALKFTLRDANGALLATAETLEGTKIAADHLDVEIAITH